MKTLVVKTVSSALFFCGVSAFSLNVNAADVSNWSDLINAVEIGENVSLIESIDATSQGNTWKRGNGKVEGNNFIINGNSNIGFSVENGTLYFGHMNVSDFQRFLINKSLDSYIDEGYEYSGGEEKMTEIDHVNIKDNKVTYDGNLGGGAIYNEGKLTIRNGSFSENILVNNLDDYKNILENHPSYTDTIEYWAGTGGFMHNAGTVYIYDSNFSNNIAEKGGAIYNTSELTITGGDFSYNNSKLEGGAIYSSGRLILNSGGGLKFSENSHYSINYDDTGLLDKNDIYMDNADIYINADGGDIEFEGGITGNAYNVIMTGLAEDSIVLKGKGITGAAGFSLNGTTLDLHTNVTAGDLFLINNPSIVLNVDTKDGNLSSPKMFFEGDVSGNANIVVSTSDATIISPDRSVVFLEAQNDDLSTETNFTVTRVITSPYMWETKVENGDGVGSTWSIYMTEDPNTGSDARVLTPEVVAYIGVPSVVFEQHKNMIGNVEAKVSSNKFPAQGKYGLREDHYRNQAGLNMWVAPVYSYADVSYPVEFEADITGIDLGFDIQGDINNKLGLFGSYRKGEYEFSGTGEEYSSELSSDITDNSFMLGAYYRYDKDNFWSFSTLYVGQHRTDISVEDGAISEDVNATQYGASFEIGHTFVPAYNLTLDPSFGIFYTGADIDTVKDDFSKTAKYDLMHVFEGELSVKLEKTFNQGYGYSKVYIKPSIVQSFVIADGVNITELGELDSYDNQTLGRIEVGGRIAVDSKLSIYGYANYTSGNDYSNVSAGLGLNYRLQ